MVQSTAPGSASSSSASATGRRRARARPRRHPPRGHGPAGPQGGGSELEARPLHPLADLLGLLLAGARAPIVPAAPPSSGSPPGWRAGRGARRRGHRPVLQGPGAPARIGPVPLDASLGHELHDEVPEEWLWCGRRVKVVDGTTVSMPDTAANQREYPQSPSQKPGLGFPIARMVVVFCLATGGALEAALGKYQGKQTGENALFRRTWEGFRPATCRWGTGVSVRISTSPC